MIDFEKDLNEVRELFDQGFRDPNKFVYHYTPRETVIEKILPKLRLRFGEYSKLNDPLEYKDFKFGIQHKSDTKIGNASEITNAFSDGIKSNCRILCVSKDIPFREIPAFCFTEPHYNISCAPSSDHLSRGYGHPRMWAQYASSHDGACLMFDRNALNEDIFKSCNEIGAIIYGSVQYNQLEMEGEGEEHIFNIKYEEIIDQDLPDAIDAFIRKHYKRLYFRKTLDWFSEFEYRWIIRGHSDSDVYVPINNSLKAIIIGDKFPPVYLSTLRPICDANNVLMVHCHWHNGLPSLSPYYEIKPEN